VALFALQIRARPHVGLGLEARSASIATMTERPVKITFGEMRESGVPHPDLLRAFDSAQR